MDLGCFVARLQPLTRIFANALQHLPPRLTIHPCLAVHQTLRDQGRNALLCLNRQILVGITDCLHRRQVASADKHA